MDSKTELASECSARTEAKECEYYNDIESVAYECICGNVEINNRKYIPEDKANLLKQEITRLKAELETERELRKELVAGLKRCHGNMTLNVPSAQRAGYKEWISCREYIASLIEKAKN